MPASALLLVVLGLGLAGWLAARARAATFRRAAPHGRIGSLPVYHGWYAALWIAVPALLFALVWGPLSNSLVMQSVLADPAAAHLPAFGMQRETILAEARAVATGAATGVFNPDAEPLVAPFAAALSRYQLIGFVVQHC